MFSTVLTTIIFRLMSAALQTLDIKSNESAIYALIGWGRCSSSIENYENCKKTGNAYHKDPTLCYDQARQLQNCYNEKALKIKPLCMPVFNDLRECMFQGDSHFLACKEEINQLVYCENNPKDYVQFLKASTPQQRLPRIYDFHKHAAKFDYN